LHRLTRRGPSTGTSTLGLLWHRPLSLCGGPQRAELHRRGAGDWSLAKVMGAWLAFAKGSNQFSISHLIQMGFFGLSLQQPEEVTGRRPHGLGVAPRRQTVKVLGAPIPEDPDVSPQEH